MSYSKLKDTWIGMVRYKNFTENYTPRITIPYPQWQRYISEGNNTLYGDAIIPGGTMQTGFGQSGAVYKGHVRQGYGYGF
jgi:hypothetical protein